MISVTDGEPVVRLQLIRGATLLLNYSGTRILVDPDLAPRHSRPSFTGRSPNPMVDLAVSADALGEELDVILVSHLHQDHFDRVDALPKDPRVLCQPGDEHAIAAEGFAQVEAVADATRVGGITITRTAGRHGLGEVGVLMGAVSGFVLQAPDEPTVYWAGDTVLCDEVVATLADVEPAVVVTHSCGARWPNAEGERELIVMDAAQTIEVCRLTDGVVIATHMESLDHGTISRVELREAARVAGIPDRRLLIPADGDLIDQSSWARA